MLETGRLRFTDSAAEAASGAAVHVVCVGAPQQPDSDAADVRFVDSAVRTVAMHADCDELIVGKSTVPETVNTDLVLFSEALDYDDRIGHRFLNAGLGFGGGCLPKDIRAFIARAGELGASAALTFLHRQDQLPQTRESGFGGGRTRRRRILRTQHRRLPGGVQTQQRRRTRFTCVERGRRDAPKGAIVRVHDRKAITNARARFPTLTYCEDLAEACRNVDLIVLATEWDLYGSIDPVAFRSLVCSPRLLDTRNAVDLEYWVERRMQVYALGRSPASAFVRSRHPW